MTAYSDLIHAGRPLEGVEIIDFHAHMGPYYNMHIPAHSPDEIVRLMDRCGIAKTIVSPCYAWNTDLVYANSRMLDAVRAHRGRLYGACSVNGHHPELSIDDLHRTFEDPSVVMIKVHPMLSRCRLDDKRMEKIYDFAAKRRLVILSHTWIEVDPHGNPDLFTAVAKDHPEVRWLMGHSGGPLGSRKAVELAGPVPNIFLDITLSMCPARQIEFFVREVGSPRVLFGTDNPFIDPRPQIGRVALADISEEDKRNIFGANARRLVSF